LKCKTCILYYRKGAKKGKEGERKEEREARNLRKGEERVSSSKLFKFLYGNV